MTRTFSASLIAKFFLGTVDRKSGDNITQLKLQKLLYFAQGFHLALHDGKALFPDEILARKHGPVVKSIYIRYREYKWQAINPQPHFDINDYPPEIRELLETVASVYGQYSAKSLENRTHEEPPWKNTPLNQVISQAMMREFFSTLVESGKEGKSVAGEPVWPTNSLIFQQRRELSERMEPNRGRLRSIAQRFQSLPASEEQ